MDDEEPDLIAATDQAAAAAQQIARWLRSLYSAYLVEGFTELKAMRLVVAQIRQGRDEDDE